MLKLNSLRFKGIGRFAAEQEIDFKSKSHLIQIDGDNRNTGGSSGAGKSTIGNAFSYLLGINEISIADLQSRLTKDGIAVDGDFEGGITVSRSKKNGLVIKIGDNVFTGSSKDIEAKLDEIIGVPRHLFKRMCYKRQDQGGFFLNLTAKETYEFLSDTLGLSEYQAKIEKIELLNKSKKSIIDKELITAEGIKNTTIKVQSLKDSTLPPETVDASQIIDLEFRLQAIVQKLENDQREYKQSLESIGTKPIYVSTELPVNKEIIKLKSEIESTKNTIKNNQQKKQELIQQANQALASITQKLSSARYVSQTLSQKKLEVEHLDTYLAILNKHTCPTCERDWQNSGSKISELEHKVAALRDQMVTMQAESEKITMLVSLVEKTQQIIESRKNIEINTEEENWLSEIQKKLTKEISDDNGFLVKEKVAHEKLSNEWLVKKASLDEVLSQTTSAANQNKHDLEIKIGQIKNTIESYKKQLFTYQNNISNINSLLKDNTNLLRGSVEIKALAEKQLLIGEESLRLIKMFTLQKFQEALDYIGDRSTQLLRNIPNMANSVISFEGSRETKSGSVRNEVEAIINLESDIKIPIKTLCGGERAAADFAVDLSVGEFIETNTGKGINIFIIDEGFNGLDSIGKIECMEILKSLNTNKKIVMIDHSSEVKASVHDIIKVIRIGEESHIEAV